MSKILLRENVRPYCLGTVCVTRKGAERGRQGALWRK